MLAAPAAAETLALLGPRSRVAPEGFFVALTVRGDDGTLRPPAAPRLFVEGAKLSAATDQGPLHSVLVLPNPGAREVVVRAESGELRTEQRFELGPPAARVELSLEPATPVKGRDRAATLTVRILAADGKADRGSPPPILRANVGTIEALTQRAPGEYSARYVLPETRHPEVAIVVAFAPWPHPGSVHGTIGALRVPLATSIDLPGHTEPFADMSLEVAGESFGPVKAGRDGRFLLPVIVPPGYRFARGTAVDRVGNRRVSRVDLQLPPTDQLACVLNPQRLPSNGTSAARLVCAASDPYGKPAPQARITVRSSRGKLSGPSEVEAGLWQWTFISPKEGSGPARLEASWQKAGASSKESLEVELVQGPAARLDVELDEPVAHLGGAMRIGVSVLDLFGAPRPGAQVLAEAPLGELSTAPLSPEARTEISWKLPPVGPLGPARLAFRAVGPPGSAPARLIAFDQGGSLVVGVLDLAGLPVPGERLIIDGAERVTGANGTVAVGPLAPGTYEVAHAIWQDLRQTVHVLDATGTIFPEDPPPGTPPVHRDVQVAPPVPVNVQLRVQQDVVTWWIESPDGALLPDREVAIRVSPGTRSELPAEAQRRKFRVESAERSTVSVTDVLTGVTAIAEVVP